jgi:hypothetical protein
VALPNDVVPRRVSERHSGLTGLEDYCNGDTEIEDPTKCLRCLGDVEVLLAWTAVTGCGRWLDCDTLPLVQQPTIDDEQE